MLLSIFSPADCRTKRLQIVPSPSRRFSPATFQRRYLALLACPLLPALGRAISQTFFQTSCVEFPRLFETCRMTTSPSPAPSGEVVIYPEKQNPISPIAHQFHGWEEPRAIMRQRRAVLFSSNTHQAGIPHGLSVPPLSSCLRLLDSVRQTPKTLDQWSCGSN